LIFGNGDNGNIGFLGSCFLNYSLVTKWLY